jgi:hypothetical protein
MAPLSAVPVEACKKEMIPQIETIINRAKMPQVIILFPSSFLSSLKININNPQKIATTVAAIIS